MSSPPENSVHEKSLLCTENNTILSLCVFLAVFIPIYRHFCTLKDSMQEFWTDQHGKTWKVPSAARTLQFNVHLHNVLRCFIYYRDHYTCQICGLAACVIPENYDGSRTLWAGQAGKTFLVIDHKVSRRNGGTHHPENLQTL